MALVGCQMERGLLLSVADIYISPLLYQNAHNVCIAIIGSPYKSGNTIAVLCIYISSPLSECPDLFGVIVDGLVHELIFKFACQGS